MRFGLVACRAPSGFPPTCNGSYHGMPLREHTGEDDRGGDHGGDKAEGAGDGELAAEPGVEPHHLEAHEDQNSDRPYLNMWNLSCRGVPRELIGASTASGATNETEP